MKKVLTMAALAISALTLSAGVQAGVLRTTLDFETPIDIANAPFAPYLTQGDKFLQPGFAGHDMLLTPFSTSSFASPGSLVGEVIAGTGSGACAGIACPVNNNTNFLNMYDDGVLGIEAVDGFSFSLKSFKASFIGNGDPTFAIPGAVRMRGVRNGIATDFLAVLAGPNAAGALNFATYTTDAAYAAIEFDFVLAYGLACTSGSGTGCSSFSTNRAQFAIDDVVIEHVPEPASLALLGAAGFAALGARRRRAV